MGAVYEVVHRETLRRRALKVLLPSLVSDPEARARFAQEASITAEIDADQLVETYDAGVDVLTGAPYIVMELLRGESFGDRLARRQRHEPSEVVEVLAQVALALEQTHRRGIVHRDLKPDNLFLCRHEDGVVRVKVLDFGIAKVVAQAAAAARSTANIGTPLYMAPEQLDGSVIGAETDLFALTHIAFELLTGESYWEAELRAAPSTMVLLKWMDRGMPEPASARASRLGVLVGPSFDPWFERGTARDPRRRFHSAIELVDAFAGALGVRRSGPGAARGSLAEILTVSQRPEPAGAGALGTDGGTTLPRGAAPARRSHGAMVTPVEARRSARSRLALAILSGIVAALLIGGVVVVATRGSSRATVDGSGTRAPERDPQATEPSVAASTSAGLATTTSSSTVVVAPVPSATASGAPKATPTVRATVKGGAKPTTTADCAQAAWRCRKP
ncbi:MAG: protein kinase [Polyangiaceae bacterium]|nr:protein kinase [Polyangiaceae bacterium]